MQHAPGTSTVHPQNNYTAGRGSEGWGLPGLGSKTLKKFFYIYNIFLHREPKNCKNAICQSVKAVKVGARGEEWAGGTWTKNNFLTS